MPATLETSLMLGIAQIVDGDEVCEGCERPACFTVWTGADPEPAPYCKGHALLLLKVTGDVANQLFAGEDD